MTGSFFVTFVYGFNDGKLRDQLWLDIQELALKIDEAWMILGDYNEILHQNKRFGKKTIMKPSLSLRDCMTNCQMENLKYSGCFYTWTNKQRPEDRVYSKIDRAMVNMKWTDQYPNSEAVFLPEGIFDHSPILISFYLVVEIGKQPFRYFRMWKEASSYATKVSTNWNKVVLGTEMYKLVLKLKRLKQEVLAREEFTRLKRAYLLFLARKAKTSWVMNGDENTAIFHASLKARRIQNRIYSIHTEQGTRVDTVDGVQRAFLDYYQNLLGTQLQSRRKVSQAIVDLGPGISEAHSRLLLRRVLPDLIAENQGGFVHGRYIAHNIMICQDLVQHYGRKNCKPSCLIKVDLQKAYDTIEWDFIEEMLAAFKFPKKLIQLIMICVRTPKFSLMLNGSLCGFFAAKRGLRQGDPMSPLLFVLGMEYLSRIMIKVGSISDYKYHAKCKSLRLNHLCFADDLLMFCHGYFISILWMLRGLKLFSGTSGLVPNQNKSAIYCSGMIEAEVNRILEASGFARSQLPFRYLGIPICSKRIYSVECGLILEKMIHRIRQWSSRNLSYMGRVTLINSVLMSIHSYWAQIMILPKRILKEIDAICRAFLWRGMSDNAGPGLVAWHTICNSKTGGGLGFKRVVDWNIAAIGKYIWAIASKKDNLWVKWIHNIYLKQLDWWDYKAPLASSWYWRKMVAVKDMFKAKIDLASFAALEFIIKMSHDLLFASPLKVHWAKFVWERFSVPKHRFVKKWLGWKVKTEDYENLLQWIGKTRRWSRFRKSTLIVVIASLIYHIWRVRNDILWSQKVWSTAHIVQVIQGY
ncbi:uncharacterized protein LOC133831475 [Humulus lupulus]|uniref:uncharacterized protein LOC133831475 n=1 Tax=Humulus lupulus TaxID=3486 RepID=UPI002B402EBB|nr:uncharacterized protein LOC133831475 [Humulus lupulus]